MLNFSSGPNRLFPHRDASAWASVSGSHAQIEANVVAASMGSGLVSSPPARAPSPNAFAQLERDQNRWAGRVPDFEDVQRAVRAASSRSEVEVILAQAAARYFDTQNYAPLGAIYILWFNCDVQDFFAAGRVHKREEAAEHLSRALHHADQARFYLNLGGVPENSAIRRWLQVDVFLNELPQGFDIPASAGMPEYISRAELESAIQVTAGGDRGSFSTLEKYLREIEGEMIPTARLFHDAFAPGLSAGRDERQASAQCLLLVAYRVSGISVPSELEAKWGKAAQAFSTSLDRAREQTHSSPPVSPDRRDRERSEHRELDGKLPRGR